ncbi:hypothetical protein EON80_25265 [bacterium]|nr:MAG: hypothetical protein EON80_25265 [bacterium]
MAQLFDQLTQNPWTLLVSLPQNDINLARAALEGGAEGLKVHINVEHFASGTRFGSLAEERNKLVGIVALAQEFGASVGIVPGSGGNFASRQDFAELASIGIDYFDAYPGDAPAWVFDQTDLDIMMAAFHGGNMDEFLEFQNLGMTLCEASILPHEEYGKPLTALDLARYCNLVDFLDVPVIVPSQKLITPADVPALQKTGVAGLLIGAIVTGREAASLEAATRAFSGRTA